MSDQITPLDHNLSQEPEDAVGNNETPGMQALGADGEKTTPPLQLESAVNGYLYETEIPKDSRQDGLQPNDDPAKNTPVSGISLGLTSQPDRAPWHVNQLIMDPRGWEALLSATQKPAERGGLLFGERDQASQSVVVYGFFIPEQHRASAAYCEFDMAWVSMLRAALMSAGLDHDVTIVGWLHTHPRLSVFLSGTDINTADRLQQLNPMLLAVVVDPYTRDIGAFHIGRFERDAEVRFQEVVIEPSLAGRLQLLVTAPQLQPSEALHVLGMDEH